MAYDSSKPHRRSIRLKGYDYSRPGEYFVTLCTEHREMLFGEIVNGEMRLNPFGEIVQSCWDDLVDHYAHVELDAFMIMPNHVHGIIRLTDVNVGADMVGAGLKPAPARRHGLPEIVRAFKTFSARRINVLRQTEGITVWQRNYYEHIIRSDIEWNAIAGYIENNPANWNVDSDNPALANEYFLSQTAQKYLKEAGLYGRV